MLTEKVHKFDTGVIIGRFQVAKLHDEHVRLIESVQARCNNVVIFLGLSPLLCTRQNPLDFAARKKMLLESFPKVSIHYIKDTTDDDIWSRHLDTMIADVVPPTNSVGLFGGRDSFVDHYTGKYPTVVLEAERYVSGTEQRERISRETRNSEDFRAGMVYAAYNSYPTSYQTVDIVIIGRVDDLTRVLLARKPNETQYRFPGGFVDPTDESLEAAAAREASEETGCMFPEGAGGFEYIGSTRIDDWRYRNEKDKVCSALFEVQHFEGDPQPKPGDDVEEVRWFPLLDLINDKVDIIDAHGPLLEMFKKHVRESE